MKLEEQFHCHRYKLFVFNKLRFIEAFIVFDFEQLMFKNERVGHKKSGVGFLLPAYYTTH